MTMKTTVVAVCVLVAGAILPATDAAAAPAIAFLNPSDYQTTMTVSDKEDADNDFHVTAWVTDPPLDAGVEFEFRRILDGETTTFVADRASADAFEAHIATSQFEDGEYRLRAILFSGDSSVADVSQRVQVTSDNLLPPPTVETVEMTGPLNGDELGFFTSSAGHFTTVLQGVASEEALRARALYTTSRPGSDPFWRECGSGDVQDSRLVRVGCVLASGDRPTAVTAVALVANQTPPNTPVHPGADQSGDAHRVLPTEAVPSEVYVSPHPVTATVAVCQRLVVTVIDQYGRPIAGAPVDVHAVGPGDSLDFGVISDPRPDSATHPFRSPSGHFGEERALSCLDGTRSDQRQAEHNSPGRDDTKHIQSTSGTNADGNFAFAVYSPTGGGTEVVAWVDRERDHLLDFDDASGGTVIGWGQTPPDPSTSVALNPPTRTAAVGDCLPVDGIARSGGNPLTNANIDVHLAEPDASAAFCVPDAGGEGTTSTPPDTGGHLDGGLHTDGVRHAEVTTSSTGRFTFGITSTTTGSSAITAWHDRLDDDVHAADESSDSETVTWQPQPPRTVTIDSSSTAVRRGRRVSIFGTVTGPAACSDAGTQVVDLRTRRRYADGFRTIASTAVGPEGTYQFRVAVRRTRAYRTEVTATGVCEWVASKWITIRAL